MKQQTIPMTGQRLNQKKGILSSATARYFRKNWILYLFVLPTILWYIVFRYFPMPGVYMAFTRYKGIGNIFDAKFVGLKWFQSFFESAYAKQTLVNTLRLSLYSLALFPLPIIFAVIHVWLQTGVILVWLVDTDTSAVSNIEPPRVMLSMERSMVAAVTSSCFPSSGVVPGLDPPVSGSGFEQAARAVINANVRNRIRFITDGISCQSIL